MVAVLVADTRARHLTHGVPRPLAAVLSVARLDDPAHHHGTVFRVDESAFAPPADMVSSHQLGSYTAGPFRFGYLEHLRALWRHDPQPFLALIAQATGGHDLTLVDPFGDVEHAPRRLLAAARRQIDSSQRAKRHARARRPGGLDEPRPSANRSDATPLPDAPP